MRLTRRFLGWIFAATLLAPASMPAQEPGGPLAKQLGPADIIMPHITDSKTIEFPCFKSVEEWACEYTFATHNVTVAGHTFDMGLTKHIFFMILAAVLLCIVLIWTARSHARSTAQVGRPKGFAAGLEAVILYLRNEIYIPVLGGHGGERYVPFVLTLFFFILVLQPVRADSIWIDADGEHRGHGDARHHHVHRDRGGRDQGARRRIHRHDHLLARGSSGDEADDASS